MNITKGTRIVLFCCEGVSRPMGTKLNLNRGKFYLKFWILVFTLMLTFVRVASQVGGDATYNFMNLATSARTAALGGRVISEANGDLNAIWQNPALLNREMDKNLALNYNGLFAGAGYGYAVYAMEKDRVGTFALGTQYVDYGTFRGADIYGNREGDFYAKDIAVNVSYARICIDSSIQVGVSIKPVYSIYERYTSLGIAADLGLVYRSADGNFSAGLSIRNMGVQLKTYASTQEPLPFEIILGISQKLQYAPFRFTITAHHLQHFDMYFDSPLEQANGGVTQKNSGEKLLENILRHLIGGVEFVPSKTFYIAAAYNYQRRQEMLLVDAPGMVGFSFGAGIRTQKFSISYGHAVYHAAGGSDHFSVLVNLGNFIGKE